MTSVRVEGVRATSHPDWFRLDWRPIWERMQIPPAALPGVKWQPNQAIVEAHASVLPVLGLAVPRASVAYDAPSVLRPHQVSDVKFIRGRRGTLQASEMRTGKTCSSVYSHEAASGVLLVVGPVASRAAWHEWAIRRFGGWCDDEECTLCERLGGDRVRRTFLPLRTVAFEPDLLLPRPDVVFMSFAVARGWSELYARIPLGTLVVDECHLAGIQNRNSETVYAIRKFASMAHRVLLLSGTPLWNKPKGLWPLLDLIAPGGFGNKFFEFGRRYCDPKETAYGVTYDGASREDELRARLRELMVRHLWSDLKGNLPAFTRTIELIELPPEAAKEVQASASRLRLESMGPQTMAGELSRIRQLFAQVKLREGFALVQEATSQGRSVIVWTWHRKIAEKLVEKAVKEGIKAFGPITGQMDPDLRERQIEDAREFSRKGGVCIFVATMASASVGLNLSFIAHQIFLELDWTPAVIQQAEMRPYDGTQPVTTTFLVADCAVDRDLANALVDKLRNNAKLGLQSGIGDARDLLHASFRREDVASTLASRLLAEIEAEE